MNQDEFKRIQMVKCVEDCELLEFAAVLTHSSRSRIWTEWFLVFSSN